MRLSVIISTYNQPAWLELSLWGYAMQSIAPHEIIIADDGSDGRTRAVVDAMRSELKCDLHHVWHEDDGFRKCRILNRGIEASTGDALLFTDGDCIPHPSFVAVHTRMMKPGHFLSGGYIKLPETTSHAITPAVVQSGDATRYDWLRAHGAPMTRALLRLRAGRAGAIFDRLTTTNASFNGHSATAWRTDIINANGFDERMGYGGQDRELGERLNNAGIHGIQIRHRAHTVHLYHTRGYRTPESMAFNRAIREDTRRSKRTRAVLGLHQESATHQS